MSPDTTYQQLQARLQRLSPTNDQVVLRSKLINQLERKFMAAWQFSKRGCRPGYRLYDSICHNLPGFDHVSFYTGTDGQAVIVTQPYKVQLPDLRRALTLDQGICPDIIEATDWTFHYPGRTKLIIIKFTTGYGRAVEIFQQARHRAAVQKLYRPTDPDETLEFIVDHES
jgi:hypothetical protein